MNGPTRITGMFRSHYLIPRVHVTKVAWTPRVHETKVTWTRGKNERLIID